MDLSFVCIYVQNIAYFALLRILWYTHINYGNK